MTAYHSTAISLVSRCCPFALQLREEGTPEDRSIYQPGIVAHAILEAVQNCANDIERPLTEEEIQTTALGVCERLMSVGRSFDGHAEPPISPEAVMLGKDLALGYLAWNPMEPGAFTEVGIALDENSARTGYGSRASMVLTILDHVRKADESDEESAQSVLTVRDYKTAWSTDESELDTLQRRIQAVAAWRAYGPTDVLALQVVNVRLGKVYEKRLYRADGLDEQIGAWWADIAATCRALDAQKKLGKRPASPGRGCLSCPFVQRCEHAKDYIERRQMHRTPEQRGIAYAVVTAMRAELATEMRADTEEAPVPIPGGVVGTVAKTRQVLAPEGYATLAERWTETGGEIRGFGKALGLTDSNARSMAKTLYFDRSAKADREALLAEVLTEETVREFGIWPVQTE